MDTKKIKKEKSIQELLEFGILNIDKPSGRTSFDTSNFVKKALEEFGLRKTSHFGTLDPLVTGVLPVALNRACKLTGFFIGEDKEYVGVMKIHKDISLDEIKKAIKEKFIGNITQKPPVKSRVKREERQREIKKFEILEKKSKDISFHVECQGGTYIRKLIHDLGEYLGIGAHMKSLKRVRAGIFKHEDSVNFKEFEKIVEDFKKGNEESLKKIIIPAEEAIVKVYSVVEIKKDSVDRILHGQPIYDKNLIKKQKLERNEIISVFHQEKFIGMFKVFNSGNIFAKSEFVFQ